MIEFAPTGSAETQTRHSVPQHPDADRRPVSRPDRPGCSVEDVSIAGRETPGARPTRPCPSPRSLEAKSERATGTNRNSRSFGDRRQSPGSRRPQGECLLPSSRCPDRERSIDRLLRFGLPPRGRVRRLPDRTHVAGGRKSYSHHFGAPSSDEWRHAPHRPGARLRRGYLPTPVADPAASVHPARRNLSSGEAE